MSDVTGALVEEVLALQAEVAAARILASAPLADDPVEFLNMAVANIDAYTLPVVMTEVQRDILRERLEYTREVWAAHMREAHPGGWRGLLYAFGRMLKRVYRAFAGSAGYRCPAPSTTS